MLVFLDVIPDELILEPSGLSLRQAGVLKRWTMGYGKSRTALVAHHGHHHHAVRNALNVVPQPFGSAI